ncbi:MAG: stage III sporulation protein AC [Oscillospiraceae bacterium]
MELDLIFKIAGVGMIVAVLNMVLKKAEHEEYSIVINIAGIVIVLMMIINEISTLFDAVKNVFGF